MATLDDVLPQTRAVTLGSEAALLKRSEQQASYERFLHWHFARVSYPLNLYDRDGQRLVEGLLEGSENILPDHIVMPAPNAAGSHFVVVDAQLFFLFDRLDRWPDAPADVAFVAIEVARDRIPGFLGDEAPDSDLTKSEYDLLAHLLSGLDLKTAAEVLGASYDTKRKQVQVLLSKLGSRSQNALLRRLSIEITSRLLDELLLHPERNKETALVRRQFGRDVVVNRISVGEGIEVPIWDFGDRQGQPVLYFHSMLCPTIYRDDFSESLKQNGLRWLVVPRHFLGFGGTQSAAQRMAHVSAAIRATLDYLCDQPVICLGESAGVSWALHFSRHNADIVNHLMLVSTPQPAYAWETARTTSIYAELSLRLKRNPQVITGLARVYNALARSNRFAQKGLNHLYRNAPADLAEVERLFTQDTFADWLQLIANEAAMSSMDEFQNINRNWAADLKLVACGISFLQGAQDPFFPPDEIAEMARSLPGASFELLEEAGHLAMGAEFPKIVAHLARIPHDSTASTA
jgi:pimeloyl-ACP methyl ester carboxylesterase/DNA-binding CsgD family transcriptional regulator